VPSAPRPCRKKGCLPFPARKGEQKCDWHWLMAAPLEVQIAAAEIREGRARTRRARVPASEWPDGGRWCAGCQSFVPTFYTRGSRCLACSHRAARASHVARTYAIDPLEEARLRRWQMGRCWVCGRRAMTRELAVDHDHVTGEVRGLLCSDDKYGCNVLLRMVLGDPEMARRLLAYVEKWPLQRMRDGEPSPFSGSPVPG
jgi:hypothetical protein